MNERDDMIAEGSPVHQEECDVCGRDNRPNRRLLVDRDNRTRKILGILCPRCMFIVGAVRDNPDILDEVAEYLDSRNDAS